MSGDVRILGEPKEIKIRSAVANSEVSFLAFLTAFDDTYNPHWDREGVYGRQDPISTFQYTDRKVSFTVDIMAASVDDGTANAEKIWLLQRMLYPRYKTIEKTKDTVISTSPLLGIYFLPLITEYDAKNRKYDFLWGTVDSVSMTPNINAGFVFTDSGNPFPKEYSLSIALNVIHKNPLGWTGNEGRNAESTALANKYRVQSHFKGK